MVYSFPAFTIVYVVAAVLSLFSAAAVNERKANPGYRLFSLLLFALFIWSSVSIFEAGVTSIRGKHIWSALQYLGVISISPLWVLFSAEYTNRNIFRKGIWKYLIWIIPIVTLILAATNQTHGLIWSRIYFPENPNNNIAIYDHGRWFYVHIVYTYLLLAIGTYWIIKSNQTSPRLKSKQSLVIIFSMVVAWINNIIYILGFSPVPGLDVTSLSFIFIALLLTTVIFRNRLFDLVPLARNIIIDHMTDGLIVLDTEDRISDINPAALELTRYQGPLPMGMTIWEMFREHSNLIEPLRDVQNLRTELTLPGDPPRHLEIKNDPFEIEGKTTSGQIITIRDITQRKVSELEEQEQRQFAEALANNASVINSTLDLDGVLSHILDNVGLVIPHDTANIALVDKEGIVRFTKARGYDKHGAQNLLFSIKQHLDDIPNMKKMKLSGKGRIEADTWQNPDWVKILPTSNWIRSYIGAPVMRKDKLLGFINLDAETPNFFQEKHLVRLQALADQAAVAIENARMFEEMEQLAITDSTTGLYNRRFFFAFAVNEVERSKRYHKNLSLIMMDIDHFKNVNDGFGHQIGDQVLKNISDISLSILRKVDVMGRYGGEEFVVLLPETEETEAAHAAQRICTAIASARINTGKGIVKVTVSVGVAQLSESTDTLDKLLTAADEAMYAAKNAGRNQVHVF